MSDASLGKMPTTSLRRPISRLTRSSGFVERSLLQCLGEAVEREQVLLGGLEQLGDLRRGRCELLDHRADALARLVVPSALKTSRSAADTSARCEGQQQPDDSRPAMAALFTATAPAGLLHHFYRLDRQAEQQRPPIGPGSRYQHIRPSR
jgi:hypothetical protein